LLLLGLFPRDESQQREELPLMAKFKRKKLFVDAKVQGALLVRAVWYWVACVVAAALILVNWRMITGPVRPFFSHFDDLWYHFGPAFLASLLLLPIIAFDSVRLSNRFVGPVLRIRRTLRSLAKGEPVTPIRLRDNDFWHELADEVNAVAERLQRIEAAAKEECSAV
jgi:hypothetical protein